MTAGELIVPVQDTSGAGIVPPSLDQAREFTRQSRVQNTLRGYRADWRDFCAWCDAHRLGPLPASPETVAAYIAECARRLKVGSIQRRDPIWSKNSSNPSYSARRSTLMEFRAGRYSLIRRSLGRITADQNTSWYTTLRTPNTTSSSHLPELSQNHAVAPEPSIRLSRYRRI